MKNTEQTLINEFGGNLWEKNGYRRIYLNDALSLAGFDISYYGTGNVSSARLDGQKISNAKARELLGVKVYWCCEHNELVISGNARMAGELHERLENKIITATQFSD